MEINGREINFELNVQSHEEICAICPDGDLARMGELYANPGTRKAVEANIKIAIALNRGYEDHKHFDDPNYSPRYLTEEDFRFYPYYKMPELEKELSAAMTAGMKETVETDSSDPVPQKNADEAKE
jgi:hypothetical protein